MKQFLSSALKSSNTQLFTVTLIWNRIPHHGNFEFSYWLSREQRVTPLTCESTSMMKGQIMTECVRNLVVVLLCVLGSTPWSSDKQQRDSGRNRDRCCTGKDAPFFLFHPNSIFPHFPLFSALLLAQKTRISLDPIKTPFLSFSPFLASLLLLLIYVNFLIFRFSAGVAVVRYFQIDVPSGDRQTPFLGIWMKNMRF